MASVMCLQIIMQEEDILEHTMLSAIHVNIKSTCRPFIEHRHAPHNTIEHTHAKDISKHI